MKPEWMDAIKAPDPSTLVDRLNGIYPSALGPYKASPLEKEAAGEILRLREELDAARMVVIELDCLLRHSLPVNRDTPVSQMAKDFLKKYK